jgi:hypothetical protein
MLTDLKASGWKVGLSSSEVSRLFVPQIAASRRFQEELIAGWRAGVGVPKMKPVDLATEIRPRLDRINQGMLSQWVLVCRSPFDWADREEALRMLQLHGIPAEVARIAVSPLGGK